MIGQNNYHPWALCTTPDGRRFKKYTQRTSAGFKCCQYPDVQDIIYKIESDPSLISQVNFLQSAQVSEQNFKDYLTTYENVVQTCKYNTSSTNPNLLDSGIVNFNNNIVATLDESYNLLYEYVKMQIKLFYVLFQNGPSSNKLHLVKFDTQNNNIICGEIANTVSPTFLKSTDKFIPKYFSYHDMDDIYTYKYIPFCAKNGHIDSALKKNFVTDVESKIFGIRLDKDSDKICNSISCKGLTGYSSYAGQNILGKNSVKQNVVTTSENESTHWYHDLTFYFILFGIFVFILVATVFHSRSYFSDKYMDGVHPDFHPTDL